MAKKTTKRSASKSKAAKSSKPAKRPGGGGKAPFKVSTGAGATPMELGSQLVASFNQGKGDQWIAKVWSPSIESIEGVGVQMGWRGVPAVVAKGEQWMSEHTIHGASAEGPYVGATGFSVKLRMDVEVKATGERRMMEEIGVYTVKNGKIIREEFMYSAR